MSKFITKNKKIILIVLTILIALIFFGINFLNFHSVPSLKPSIATELNYTDTVPGLISVYDFMNNLRNEGKINFSDKNYISMGKFIVSINGIENNGEQNWIYYVNGVEAQVGVSNYKIKQGDIVSWKFEKN